jgi:hypothetical protein
MKINCSLSYYLLKCFGEEIKVNKLAMISGGTFVVNPNLIVLWGLGFVAVFEAIRLCWRKLVV